MSITLRTLTADDCETVRQWRNADLSPWRTPHLLTAEMQADFYRDVICNRNAPHRFWVVDEGSRLVGMVGLTNIQWENRLAELNLIMRPTDRYTDAPFEAAGLLLEQSFDFMGLETVCGECYDCSSWYGVWKQTAIRYGAYTTHLPRRKFWQGKFHESLYLSIDRTMYEQNRKAE